MAELERIAARGLAGEFRVHEPMRKHTSWRAGGSADRAYFPRDMEDLARFMRTIPADEPVYMLGLGSNLLVRDGGLRGTVIFTHGALREIRLEPTQTGDSIVYAEAGVASPKVARFAATHGLLKAEFLAGIPGTVGGALAMNAGCYGSETWDVVHEVLCMRRDGTFVRRTREHYDIAYRHVELHANDPQADTVDLLTEPAVSVSRAPAEEVFAAAWLKLAPGDGDVSRRVIKELLQRRIATQPLDQPNAGSVFRNPPGEYAARLIEACGLKGHRIGGAQVSDRHANFIVNTGGASAADIETLIETVQQAVWDRHAVMLEREVRIIGEPA